MRMGYNMEEQLLRRAVHNDQLVVHYAVHPVSIFM